MSNKIGLTGEASNPFKGNGRHTRNPRLPERAFNLLFSPSIIPMPFESNFL
jgi:hypothetical protein